MNAVIGLITLVVVLIIALMYGVLDAGRGKYGGQF